MRSDRDSRAGRAGLAGYMAPARLSVPIRIPQSAIRNAFTLIELMVVIAIIAILAGLLMPAIRSALNKAHEGRTQNLIHQCEIAATSYFNDHGDYPPSTWADLFQTDPFKTISTATGNNVLDLAANGILYPDGYNKFLANPNFKATNDGIEVFLACVATGYGGPYLQPSDWELKNTNADFDMVVNGVGIIATDTNWYFHGAAPLPLYELADWWGNPLIYIHNRDYALTDGVTPGWSNVNYTGANNESIQALSRSIYGFKSGTPPNLDSYQLYSLGSNGVGNLMQTGANTYAVPAPGQLPWNDSNPWTLQQMHFLANWEE